MAHPLSAWRPPFNLQRRTQLVAALVTICFVFTGTAASAATKVSGRWQQRTGKKIVLELALSSPAPLNIIVEQYLSGPVEVVTTTPHAKKIEQDGKVIKWLLRDVHSGTITLQTILKKSHSEKVSAIIRYRTPQSGAFTEIVIK